MALGSKGMYRNLAGLTKSETKRVKRSASTESLHSSVGASRFKQADKESDDAKEQDKAMTEVYKVSAARVWKYSMKDIPLLATGILFAIANGCVMPSVAFVFAELLTVFYMDDVGYMRDRSSLLSGVMGAVSVGAFIVMGIQGGIFGNIGERLTTAFARAPLQINHASRRRVLRRKGKHGRRVDHVASGGYHKGSNDDWTEFREHDSGGGGAHVWTHRLSHGELEIRLGASRVRPVLSIGEMLNMKTSRTRRRWTKPSPRDLRESPKR